MIKSIHLLAIMIMAAVIASCSKTDGGPAGSGLIEATEAIISAEASGRLEVRYFDEGDEISKGDIIVLIDSSKTALKLNEARASYRAMQSQRENALIRIEQIILDDSLAQKEFQRISRLMASGSANQQQYDRAENAAQNSRLARQAAAVALRTTDAELARIEASIDLLKQQIADCTPTAPVSGTVVTTYVEEGELVAPGKALIKIAQLDTMTVKIYLPPGDLSGVSLGEGAEIDPEIEGQGAFPGIVTWISPEAEFTPKNVQTRQARADLVYAVKIRVPNPDQIFKIGMPVYVRISR